MKTTIFYSIILLAVTLISNRQLVAQEKQEIFLADPTIYVHDGNYYLTGTGGSGREAASGFTVLASTDLKTWAKPIGAGASAYMILTKGKQAFGTEGFLAPQLFQAKDTYYLPSTATE